VISNKTYAICPVASLNNSTDNFQVFKAGLLEVTICSEGEDDLDISEERLLATDYTSARLNACSKNRGTRAKDE
jgi:hypothetical protein